MRIEEHRNAVFSVWKIWHYWKSFRDNLVSATGYLVYASAWMYVVSSLWFNALLPSEMCTTMCSIITTTTRGDISVNCLLLLCYLKNICTVFLHIFMLPVKPWLLVCNVLAKHLSSFVWIFTWVFFKPKLL